MDRDATTPEYSTPETRRGTGRRAFGGAPGAPTRGRREVIYVSSDDEHSDRSTEHGMDHHSEQSNEDDTPVPIGHRATIADLRAMLHRPTGTRAENRHAASPDVSGTEETDDEREGAEALRTLRRTSRAPQGYLRRSLALLQSGEGGEGGAIMGAGHMGPLGRVSEGWTGTPVGPGWGRIDDQVRGTATTSLYVEPEPPAVRGRTATLPDAGGGRRGARSTSMGRGQDGGDGDGEDEIGDGSAIVFIDECFPANPEGGGFIHVLLEWLPDIPDEEVSSDDGEGTSKRARSRGDPTGRVPPDGEDKS